MKKKILISCFSLIAIIALAGVALARTRSTATFKPNDIADPYSCYKWFPAGGGNAGLERVCNGTFAVDFDLVSDYSGFKYVTVWAARPSDTAQLSCNLWTSTAQGGYTPGTVVDLTAPHSSNFQPVVLPAQSLPSGGTMFVRCLMAKNTRILLIDYNP